MYVPFFRRFFALRRVTKTNQQFRSLLRIEPLESRVTPTLAITWTPSTNNLDIVATGNQSDEIVVNTAVLGGNTFVQVNGSPLSVLANEVQTLNIQGDASSNSINLAGVTASEFTTLNGITVDGGGCADGDSLQSNDEDNIFSITSPDEGGITGAGFASFTFLSVELLKGGAGDDIFVFSDGIGLSTGVEGGSGNNTLDMSAFSLGNSLTFNIVSNNTGNVSDSVSFSFVSIQNLVGGADADIYVFSDGASISTVDGKGGTDLADLSDYTSSIAVTVTGTNKGSLTGLFSFEGIESISTGSANDSFSIVNAASLAGTMNGGGGSNSLNYSAYTTPLTVQLTGLGTSVGYAGQESSRQFDNITTIVGGSGSDTLIGTSITNLWNLSGSNAGSLNYGLLAFSSFENLTGGSAFDSFVFANGASLSGAIDGSGGHDTLDFQAYLSARTFVLTSTGSSDGYNGTQTSITSGFSNIDEIVGSTTSSDTLTGPSIIMDWYVTSNNAGQLIQGTNFLTFSSIENLVGGSMSDTFVFSDGATISGSIAGGAGADSLNYLDFTTAVLVNFASFAFLGVNDRSASNINNGNAGSVSSIENAYGSPYNDILIADGSSNYIYGDLGLDTLVAFGGISTLNGSSGDDLYVLGPNGSSSVTIIDSDGHDKLDFSNSTSGVTLDLDSTVIQTLFTGSTLTITIESSIEDFLGSVFNDDVTVRPLITTPRFLDGNTPTFTDPGYPPGDKLTLELRSPPLPVPPSNGTLTISCPSNFVYSSDEYAPVLFQNFETFTSTAPIPNLVINATEECRDYRLVRNGIYLEVREITSVPPPASPPGAYPGTLFFNATYATLQSVTVNGRVDTDNYVVLDFGGSGTPIPDANANPIPVPATTGAPSFTFNGDALGSGPVSGTDKLFIAAGGTIAPFSAISTTYTGSGSGTSTFTDTTPTALGKIAFTGLDLYDLSGGHLGTGGSLDAAYAVSTTVADLTFDFSSLGSATQATFLDVGTSTDTVSRVQSTSTLQFVPTNFTNPTSSLTVNTGSTFADTVSLGLMDTTFTPRTLNLTGNNTNDTFQLISTGFLNPVAASGMLPSLPGPGLNLTTATFTLNGYSDAVAYVEDTNNGTSRLILFGGATLTTGDSTDHTYNGVITSTGSLLKQGTGAWTLGGSSPNTYTGTTTVNEGRLDLNKTAGVTAINGNLVIGDNTGGNDADIVRLLASDQIINTASVTINDTGLWNLNNFNEAITTLTMQSGTSFAGTINTGTGTFTLLGNATLLVNGTGATAADINGLMALPTGTHTFTVANGTMSLTDTDLLVTAATSGVGSLTKTGPGRLEFSGANTYSGLTLINQGTYHLTGSLTGTGSAVRLNGTNVVFTGGTTGVLSGSGRGVTASSSAVGATVRQLQRITNTVANGIGVSIEAGATVRLLSNTGSGTTDGISKSATNIVANGSGARLFMEGNKVNGTVTGGVGSSVGLLIAGGAYVDAGMDGGGYDFTGLGGGVVGGGSTGGNVFGQDGANGYTNASPAINNQNVNVPNSSIGPQGAPNDAYAQGNTFNGTTALSLFGGSYAFIENLVRHDYDSSALGFVNYVTNGTAVANLINDANGPMLYYSRTATADANNNWLQRSMIRNARVSYDDYVFIGTGGVTIQRTTATTFNATGGTYTGAITTVLAPVVFNPLSTEKRYFNYDHSLRGSGVEVSGSLVDGIYLLNIVATNISTFGSGSGVLSSGTVTDMSFHRLFGDVDGNRKIDTTDINAFTAAANSIAGQSKYREYLNFDADNDVDASDQTQFTRRRQYT